MAGTIVTVFADRHDHIHIDAENAVLRVRTPEDRRNVGITDDWNLAIFGQATLETDRRTEQVAAIDKLIDALQLLRERLLRRAVETGRQADGAISIPDYDNAPVP